MSVVRKLWCILGCVVLIQVVVILTQVRKHPDPAPPLHEGQHSSSAVAQGTDTVACDTQHAVPHNTSGYNVLVLGSGGLVGSAIVHTLEHLGHRVIQVMNRYDVDLRQPDALEPILSKHTVQFCFFLACEVGGAKFLSSDRMQQLSSVNSRRIHEQVTRSLEKHQVPFLFSSSQLVHGDSMYGKVKLHGEDLTLATGGKVIRLWNAYGNEPIGLKSHVVSDWIFSCLRYGSATSLSNGLETRWFMHADDLAKVLASLMLDFAILKPITDLAPVKALSMRELAAVISINIPGGCNITFASAAQSPSAQSALPTNHVPVHGRVECGIRRVVQHFQDEQRRADSGAIYLSFIAACRNDDYNGVRSRLFTFLHFLGTQLSKTSLRYEVIIVQDNARQTDFSRIKDEQYDEHTARTKDLPLSMLIPLSQGTVSLSLRIITIPREVHRFPEKGEFLWEYVAKNTGARIARGQFLLFTNVDNIFPTTLIAFLSKYQLQPTRFYRSGWLEHDFTTQESCDARGTGHGACVHKGSCSPSSDGGQLKYCDDCLGDFSIFHREAFMATGGYLEYPQNIHMETAHVAYAKQLAHFSAIEERWTDDTVCHRVHERNSRPDISIEVSTAVQMLTERAPDADWGYSSVVNTFSEARVSGKGVWEWGFNPEAPHTLQPHHPIFEELFPAATLGKAPFTPEYHVDFAGTKTSYEYDCKNWFRYRRYHLSRRLPCDRIDSFQTYRLGEVFADIPIFGDPPIIDEEYFEWLSLMKALRRWRDEGESRPFVAIELGARYGTWIARAGVMARRLRPSVGAQVCAVEADSVGFAWLQEHLAVNALTDNATLLRGLIGETSSPSSATIQWEPASNADPVPVFTVSEVLDRYPVVDIMHVDVQGAERAFSRPDIRKLASERVRALHIGTHLDEIHRSLLEAYKEPDWRLVHEFPGGGLVQSEMGPIRLLWDGEISVQNTAFLRDVDGTR